MRNGKMEQILLKLNKYVMVAVSDTGTGMSAEVIAKAFDPFFTTKEVGKGSGLGLSQIFGFVRQSNGHVKIYSEEGLGSAVIVYLPRFDGDAGPSGTVESERRTERGSASETVLVVEDDERVRTFSTEALRELGYSVIEAGSGPQAMALINAGLKPDLLFTDVVMPGMTGRELADAALSLISGLKVLYTTGYTRNAVVHNGVLDNGTHLLQKPFSLDQLAEKIRKVLDE